MSGKTGKYDTKYHQLISLTMNVTAEYTNHYTIIIKIQHNFNILREGLRSPPLEYSRKAPVLRTV